MEFIVQDALETASLFAGLGFVGKVGSKGFGISVQTWKSLRTTAAKRLAVERVAGRSLTDAELPLIEKLNQEFAKVSEQTRIGQRGRLAADQRAAARPTAPENAAEQLGDFIPPGGGTKIAARRTGAAKKRITEGLSPEGSGTSILSNEEFARSEVFYKIIDTCLE